MAKITPTKQFAAIEYISIAGIVVRMGSVGLHVYAESYLSAARLLPAPSVPFDPVRPYLVCHSIELSLKAFLSLQGMKMLKLAENKLGHNLDSLLVCAMESGMDKLVQLSEPNISAIELATIYYAGKVFEYPAVAEAFSAYPQLPQIESLFDTANILVESLRQPCREAK